MAFFAAFFLLFVSAYANGEGEVESLRQNTYWDNGKIRQCDLYDANGYLKARAFCRVDGTTEKIEKLDRSGNKVEEALYDAKGKLKMGIDGWAAARWRYEGSQMVSQTLYDEDGKPMERKQYSESGRLILRLYREDLNIDTYEGESMALLLGKQNIAYRDSQIRQE